MRLTHLPYWFGIYIPVEHQRIANNLIEKLGSCSVSEVTGVWRGQQERCLYIVKHFGEADYGVTKVYFAEALQVLLDAGESAVMICGDAGTNLYTGK